MHAHTHTVIPILPKKLRLYQVSDYCPFIAKTSCISLSPAAQLRSSVIHTFEGLNSMCFYAAVLSVKALPRSLSSPSASFALFCSLLCASLVTFML